MANEKEEYVFEIDESSDVDVSAKTDTATATDVAALNQQQGGTSATDTKQDTSSTEAKSGASAADDPYNSIKEQFEALQNQMLQVKTDQQLSQQQIQEKMRRDAERAANQDLLETGIRNETERAQRARATYAAALKSGDHEAAATAQLAMTEATSNITNMRAGLDSIKDNPDPKPAADTQTIADPIEATIQRYTPASQAWLRAHKADIFGNPQRAKLADAAHVIAVNSGIKPDTDEYFEHLDKAMGYSKAGAAPSRGVSAPPSRQNDGSATGKRKVTLTQAEMQHCKESGTNPVEYARAKARISSGQSTLRFDERAR